LWPEEPPWQPIAGSAAIARMRTSTDDKRRLLGIAGVRSQRKCRQTSGFGHPQAVSHKRCFFFAFPELIHSCDKLLLGKNMNPNIPRRPRRMTENQGLLVRVFPKPGWQGFCQVE
jgi:hypothetical protein